MSDIKTAIVTAAAGAGIGAAIARQLAADGMRVIITDLHEGRMSKLSEELSQVVGVECPWYKLDVSDHAAVEAVFSQVAERYGRIDVWSTTRAGRRSSRSRKCRWTPGRSAWTLT